MTVRGTKCFPNRVDNKRTGIHEDNLEMAHIKLDSPIGSLGMTDDLFKLMDGACSNEKKGLFSSFWKKPILGKRATRNEFEHHALDGPSYSAESEGSQTGTKSGENGDAWNVESRDDNDQWGFNTKTAKVEAKGNDGFPPLPPSKASSAKTGSWDSSHARQLNPKVMVKRTPKRNEASQKQKDFSLTHMISQSFDSEAADDMLSINNPNFSFSEPPTEYTQLGLSGEATKLVRQDDGYQEVLASTKSMEGEELEIDTRPDVNEPEMENPEIKTKYENLIENLESRDDLPAKVEIDSTIPSFQDRLAYYKTRSNSSGLSSAANEAGKVDSPTFQAGHVTSSDKAMEDNKVKSTHHGVAPSTASPPDDEETSVQDKIKKFQPGLQAKSTYQGPGRGDLIGSSLSVMAPKSISIQGRSLNASNISNPITKNASPERRSESSAEVLSPSSGHSSETRTTQSAGALPVKNFLISTTTERRQSTEDKYDPTVGMTTKLELSSIATLAQRKAAFLSARSSDSSDNGSQHKDKRQSLSKSLRLSDNSKEKNGVKSTSTAPQKSERSDAESVATGNEIPAFKKALLSLKKSEAQGGKEYDLRKSIEIPDNPAPTSIVKSPTTLSPTNLYKKSILTLKPQSKCFDTSAQNQEEAAVSQFQKIKMQIESKNTRPESSLLKFKVPAPTKEAVRMPQPNAGKLNPKTTEKETLIPESSESTVSIVDRKKVFVSSFVEAMESKDGLLTNSCHSKASNRLPAVGGVSTVPNVTTAIQENVPPKSEERLSTDSHCPAADVGSLSVADRMKAFGGKGSKKATSVVNLSNAVINKNFIERPLKALDAKNGQQISSIKASLVSLADREKPNFQKPSRSTFTNENWASRRSVSTPRNSLYTYPLRSTSTLNEIHLSNKPVQTQGRQEVPVKSLSSEVAKVNPSNAVINKSFIERPLKALDAKNGQQISSIKASLVSLADREKPNFQKPSRSTFTNENWASRRSVSTPRNSMYDYPLRSSTSTLNEIHLSNKPVQTQGRQEVAGKNSSSKVGTASALNSSPSKERFKSIAERQSAFGSTVASKISSEGDSLIQSQQPKHLKPHAKFRSHICAFDVQKSVVLTRDPYPSTEQFGDKKDDSSGQAHPSNDKQRSDSFASTLHFFKKRSSSALLEDKRPTVDDPSVTSTKVEATPRVFSEGDHPLYVIVDVTSDASECLSPSPRMLERKIVCEPGEGMSYFEGLHLNNDDGFGTTKEVAATTDSAPSTLLPPAWCVRSLAHLGTEEDDPNTVDRYQNVKSRFSQKTLPWRQQNAAGRYLERKRHTICGDSSAQTDRPGAITLPRNSDMFCPISKSPVHASANAATPPEATPTKRNLLASLQSPFGTPVNGYSYGNNV